MSNPAAAMPSPNAGHEPQDIRPVVPRANSGNLGMWAFFSVLAIGGIGLFSVLNASREAAQTPSVIRPMGEGSTRLASPPPLALPERFLREPQPPLDVRRAQTEVASAQPRSGSPRQQLPPPVSPIPAITQQPAPFTPTIEQPRVVFDNRSAQPVPAGQGQTRAETGDRVSAERFRNPSLTVPQGTVIPAVLETALDSTRAGGARALVQRDVLGFDGTRLLIPRGSRLYGEYEANLQAGQNRALVRWTRLIRPDGVTIALDSPSSDPLGRAGIRGKVDTKFLQRFGGAILQSVLDIGVGVAVSRATDGVIVALPGALPNTRITDPQQIQPTLKVAHGTSVSVFVARDLDFASVEQ